MIQLNPAVGHDQLVGLATWLWIDGRSWQPTSATARADPVTSTVTATPKEVIWHMGDGQAVICNGPGTPYASGGTPTCAYTYRRSSARQSGETFQVKATMVWTVTWTASGAPGGGDLGTIQRTNAPVAVRVAEAQAVNNG